MNLRLITFNIQGSRRLDKQIEVVQLALSVRCDLLFIREVNFVSRREVEGFKTRFAVEAFSSLATRCCTDVGVIVFNRALLQSFSFLQNPDGRVLGFDFMIGIMTSRGDRRGGCVALYLQNLFDSNVVPDYSELNPNCESLAVECANTIIAVVYRPPPGSFPAFLIFLENML